MGVVGRGFWFQLASGPSRGSVTREVVMSRKLDNWWVYSWLLLQIYCTLSSFFLANCTCWTGTANKTIFSLHLLQKTLTDWKIRSISYHKSESSLQDSTTQHSPRVCTLYTRRALLNKVWEQSELEIIRPPPLLQAADGIRRQQNLICP